MLHGLFLIHNSLHSFTEHGCNFILKILNLAQLKSVDVGQKDFKLEELLRIKISISPTIGFKDMYKNVSYDQVNLYDQQRLAVRTSGIGQIAHHRFVTSFIVFQRQLFLAVLVSNPTNIALSYDFSRVFA